MWIPRPDPRSPSYRRALERATVATGIYAPPRAGIGAVGDYDRAFEGCENRTRVAAVIAGARFTGTLQGVALGVIVGAIGGVLMYVAGERGRKGKKK